MISFNVLYLLVEGARVIKRLFYEKPIFLSVFFLFGLVFLTGFSQGERFLDYEIVAVYPHDPEAFTQGLFFYNGYLYEGTGLYGFSSLRKVEVEQGEVLQRVYPGSEYFGEGIALVEDRILQLTWKEQKGFVYASDTFAVVDEFTYTGEGWGLTYDGEYLIMSDGSAQLIFLDPVTYQEVKGLTVTCSCGPVKKVL